MLIGLVTLIGLVVLSPLVGLDVRSGSPLTLPLTFVGLFDGLRRPYSSDMVMLLARIRVRICVMLSRRFALALFAVTASDRIWI